MSALAVGEGPDEAGELARDGHVGLRGAHPAAPEALGLRAEPAVGLRGYPRGLRADPAARGDLGRQQRAPPPRMVPGGLDEHGADVHVIPLM